jgi:hypothetical protein
MNRFVPSDSKTLQLDIDSEQDLVHFHKSLVWFSCICEEHGIIIRAMSEKRSRKRGHWHVTIKLGSRLRIMERIGLQAILGSDRTRELCNWERFRCKSSHPILFIERFHREHNSKTKRRKGRSVALVRNV